MASGISSESFDCTLEACRLVAPDALPKMAELLQDRIKGGRRKNEEIATKLTACINGQFKHHILGDPVLAKRAQELGLLKDSPPAPKPGPFKPNGSPMFKPPAVQPPSAPRAENLTVHTPLSLLRVNGRVLGATSMVMAKTSSIIKVTERYVTELHYLMLNGALDVDVPVRSEWIEGELIHFYFNFRENSNPVKNTGWAFSDSYADFLENKRGVNIEDHPLGCRDRKGRMITRSNRIMFDGEFPITIWVRPHMTREGMIARTWVNEGAGDQNQTQRLFIFQNNRFEELKPQPF